MTDESTTRWLRGRRTPNGGWTSVLHAFPPDVRLARYAGGSSRPAVRGTAACGFDPFGSPPQACDMLEELGSRSTAHLRAVGRCLRCVRALERPQ